MNKTIEMTVWEFEVFFDGDCPLCKREIAMIRRQDVKRRIRFTDISSERFQAQDIGKTFDELMMQIHGRFPDGRFVVGPEVFRRLYQSIGYGRLVAITRWPIVSQIIDVAYRYFARFRLRLTGRRCAAGSCTAGT